MINIYEEEYKNQVYDKNIYIEKENELLNTNYPIKYSIEINNDKCNYNKFYNNVIVENKKNIDIHRLGNNYIFKITCINLKKCSIVIDNVFFSTDFYSDWIDSCSQKLSYCIHINQGIATDENYKIYGNYCNSDGVINVIYDEFAICNFDIIILPYNRKNFFNLHKINALDAEMNEKTSLSLNKKLNFIIHGKYLKLNLDYFKVNVPFSYKSGSIKVNVTSSCNSDSTNSDSTNIEYYCNRIIVSYENIKIKYKIILYKGYKIFLLQYICLDNFKSRLLKTKKVDIVNKELLKKYIFLKYFIKSNIQIKYIDVKNIDWYEFYKLHEIVDRLFYFLNLCSINRYAIS